MFGYRRHSFKRAVSLLSTLRTNPDDLNSLLSLQELLISEIVLAESRIRVIKKQISKSSEGKTNFFRTRVKSLQKSIYFWKAFGDAIAFLYWDRFALKHTHYKTDNYNIKQDAGFISGSKGFEHEMNLVRLSIEAGRPCLLNDLTNTIRHGDICILLGPDPYLIEVKTSKGRNRRAIRQKNELKKLDEFYTNDFVDSFRGHPVKRVALKTTLRSHAEKFNQCIHTAYDKGFALCTPEEGVHYIAIADLRISSLEIFERINAKNPWLFLLNKFKNDMEWAPYYPFTLLIESEKALYDFLLGRLFICVVIDMEVARRIIEELGFVSEIHPDSEYPIRARNSDLEEEIRLTPSTLLRVPLESVSLRWMIQEQMHGIE